MTEIEIKFEDLKPEVQEQILRILSIEDPSEMNWDVFPMCVVTIEEEKDVQKSGNKS